jgi:hypothetical protein
VDAKYPGVVYEIARSQSGKDLDKAAWDYIPHSNGDIKAVVGFQLGYGVDKEASISLWRPRYLRGDNEPIEILDVETAVDHIVSILLVLCECKLMDVALPGSRRDRYQCYANLTSSPQLVRYVQNRRFP